MLSARNKCPFTPNQWQELEHQALIFKYMVSGVPIPPQLIYAVKTSFDSSLTPHLFSHQSTAGWGCFQVGFGRKPDPEPGRCRRTDGKKWRCSKEAYPDSKYCERHMHRGRNRSRKPVELNASSSSKTTALAMSTSFSSINTSSFSPMAPQIFNHMDPFLHGSALCVPSQHFMESTNGIDYSRTDKAYRYVHGTREGIDERSFFPEASGSLRLVPDSYQPFTMLQTFGDNNGGSKQGQQQQQCFVLGTDIKSAKPIKLEKDNETQKPMHQFLGDWTTRNNNNNNNGSWLDLASNSTVHSGKTLHYSIFTPLIVCPYLLTSHQILYLQIRDGLNNGIH